ncbi:hsp70-binding protein 1-like isoform X2 [Ostrea edulis]|uniref:hsp70-binding protein 1-like isoform X2 n=1 Tax=Ostrea edulis TaxID=37623 RepID=UPI002095A2DB|nr:hsp70-binding protein 1-like isoform X2 [Ostrea edulis]XP_055996394.1 hsp70-binding protein 1-like isoform X2 [Ostrea edulis]
MLEISDYDYPFKERRQWLNNALVDLTVSPVEKMKECLRTLTSPNVTEKKMTEALEEVIEWCENLDFAADFYKIGGYPVLKELMKHKTADIRWNTLELVAVLVQNHPFCQEMALKENLLTQMLNTLDTDDNATVKTKALYAVSCLTRENQKAQKVFADHDGFSVLMRAMQTDVEKLKIKAAFLLSSLCSNQPEFKDVMCDTGMIDQLVGVLGEEHSPFHEHTLSALLSIVSHHQRAIEECQRPELDLSEILQRRIKFLEGKDEFNEESYYAKELLKLISADDIEVQR